MHPMPPSGSLCAKPIPTKSPFGDKGTTKFAHMQEKRVIILKMIVLPIKYRVIQHHKREAINHITSRLLYPHQKKLSPRKSILRISYQHIIHIPATFARVTKNAFLNQVLYITQRSRCGTMCHLGPLASIEFSIQAIP